MLENKEFIVNCAVDCEWMIFFTISTFSERRVFLKNHSIEIHKIWQGDTSDSSKFFSIT